jgi:hypothetical protein
MESSEYQSWPMTEDIELSSQESMSRAISAPISIPLSQQSSYQESEIAESDFSESSFSHSPLRTSTLSKRKISRRSKNLDEMVASSPQEEFASTSDRSGEFVKDSRVYHAIFGTGRVAFNDGTYLGIRFDDPRYNEMKLKVIFAVPKMILMPE